MKLTLALAAVITLLAVVEGGKKWRGSRSRRTTSFGFGKSTGKSRRSSFGRKLVGGALVGAGAYAGYKATKAAAKFATLPFRADLGYQFEDWQQWSNSQGFLCRSDRDCWLNPDLVCQDYDLDFTPSAAWFPEAKTLFATVAMWCRSR